MAKNDKNQKPTIQIIPPTPSSEPTPDPVMPAVTHLPMAANSAKNTFAWQRESILITVFTIVIIVASSAMVAYSLRDNLAKGFTNLDLVAFLGIALFAMTILLGIFVVARLDVARKLIINVFQLGIVFSIYPLLPGLFFESAPTPDYVAMGIKVIVYVASIAFLEAKTIRRHFK